MFPASPVIHSREEKERHELETVLRSGLFTKAPNLNQLLDFLANRYFSGQNDQIKEYSIAIQALNRPESFDPQSDTIVRVTAHALRKKLEQYYTKEGADHEVHIQLPPGKYVLRFIHKAAGEDENNGQESLDLRSLEPNAVSGAERPASAKHGSPKLSKKILIGLVVTLAVVLISLPYRFHARKQPAVANHPPLASQPFPAQHFLLNDEIAAFTDAAEQVWNPLHGCTGGKVFLHPDHDIQGTDDQQVYRSGREGKFNCTIPIAPGSYQLRLLFADTDNDKEAARQVVFAINGGPTQAIDVVDDAEGSDIAFARVYSGIHPMPDGSIHLDFLSDAAFANAVEITPTASDLEPTFRMVAGPTVVRDADGNIWTPESFFTGGRRTFYPDVHPDQANAGLYRWERYGHFHYSLPVTPEKTYTVRLYFCEGWFGQSNGGPGGVGSRVFDVYGDGTVLLKNFDILKDHTNGTAIETIRHVRSSSHGILDLYFAPVKNYALINAIELEPEN